MKAKHIKRGFKRFGGWVRNKPIPYLLYDPKETTFVNGKVYYEYPYMGE